MDDAMDVEREVDNSPGTRDEPRDGHTGDTTRKYIPASEKDKADAARASGAAVLGGGLRISDGLRVSGGLTSSGAGALLKTGAAAEMAELQQHLRTSGQMRAFHPAGKDDKGRKAQGQPLPAKASVAFSPVALSPTVLVAPGITRDANVAPVPLSAAAGRGSMPASARAPGMASSFRVGQSSFSQQGASIRPSPFPVPPATLPPPGGQRQGSPPPAPAPAVSISTDAKPSTPVYLTGLVRAGSSSAAPSERAPHPASKPVCTYDWWSALPKQVRATVLAHAIGEMDRLFAPADRCAWCCRGPFAFNKAKKVRRGKRLGCNVAPLGVLARVCRAMGAEAYGAVETVVFGLPGRSFGMSCALPDPRQLSRFISLCRNITSISLGPAATDAHVHAALHALGTQADDPWDARGVHLDISVCKVGKEAFRALVEGRKDEDDKEEDDRGRVDESAMDIEGPEDEVNSKDKSGTQSTNGKERRSGAELQMLSNEAKGWQRVECVRLRACAVSSRTMKHILERFGEPSHVGACYDGAFNASLSGSLHVPRESRLRALDTGYCAIDEKCLNAISKLHALRVLDLEGCKSVSSSNISVLSPLRLLEWLSVRGCGDVGDVLLHLCVTSFPLLQHLDASWTTVSDVGVQQYFADEATAQSFVGSTAPVPAGFNKGTAAAKKSGLQHSLTHLNLADSRSGDIACVLSVKSLPSLRFLSLRRCFITDTALNKLGADALIANRSLCLDLHLCELVSASAVDSLRACKPMWKIMC